MAQPTVPDDREPAAEPPAAPARLSGAAVVVGFAALCLSYMLNAMDRQVFYPLVPEIRAEYGFTLDQSGLLATGFTLGLALTGIPAGYLLDRVSQIGRAHV